MKALLRPLKSIVKFSEVLCNTNRNLLKIRENISLTKFQKHEIESWGSKKTHRKIKLKLTALQNMADPRIEKILEPLRQQVKEQVS